MILIFIKIEEGLFQGSFAIQASIIPYFSLPTAITFPTFRDWHHGGQFNAMLCVDCRLHYKKYGYDKVIEDRPPTPIQLKELREAKKEVQEQVK